MCKEKYILLMVICLIPFLLISATYYVDGDYPFPSQYYKTTIQDAIDPATTGDEIIVYEQDSGAYEEELLISGKGLSIICAEDNDVIIEGSNSYTIQIRYTSNTNVIDGFTIRNTSSYTCLYVNSGWSPNITIQNCEFDSGNKYIDINQASYIHLYDNVFTYSSILGSNYNYVEIENSIGGNIVSGNLFHNTRGYGIFFVNSDDVDVDDNKFTDCYNCIGMNSPVYRRDILIHHNLVYDCHYENNGQMIFLNNFTDAEVYSNTFVSNVTSGTIPVLLDCNDDESVDVELFELNIMRDFTNFEGCEEFSVDYCCYNGTIPQEMIGTGNITDDPEFEDPAADDYHLAWNSPCMDIKNFVEPWGGEDCGCFESDAHDIWIFTQNGAGIREVFDWRSFPRLDVVDGINNGEFVEACAMFDLFEYPETPEEVEIWFNQDTNESPIFSGDWDNYNLEYDWDWNPCTTLINSVRGFKLKVTDSDDDIPLRVFGEVCQANTPITIDVSEDENWIGYFLEDTQYASYALGSTVLERIDKITTDNWSAYKNNGNWIWPIKPIPTLSYGDLVILEPDYGTDFSFTWQTPSRDEIEPYVRPVPTQFSYDEDLDYMPIFMEFEETPLEIGVYVNGVCRGGEVVDFEENFHLRAYVYEEEPGYELEFVQYFGRSETKFLDYEIVNMPGRSTDKLVTGSLSDWARIRFGDPAEEEVPEQIVSLNAYPNPFNPETTISFSTTEDTENTELAIYNLKGQRVKSFKIQNSKYKIQQVVWNGIDDNGAHVSSGVYYLRMKTGRSIQTQKVVLLK